MTVIYADNPDAFESGPHVARVVVDLLNAESRNAPLVEVRNTWRETVGDSILDDFDLLGALGANTMST